MKLNAQDQDLASQPVMPYGGAREHATERVKSRKSAGRAVWATVLFTAFLAGGMGAAWKIWQRYDRKLGSAQAELSWLRDAKSRVEKDLSAAHASEQALSVRLAATENRLGKFEEDHAFVESELMEFRRIAGQFESMVDSGSLDVSYRRGRMVVELPAQLLFPSGSADLTPEGQAALTEVAEILKGVNGRRFLVAGHTDSIPVSSAQFKSNWELSVARALRVTQALIGAGVKPQRLMAAGRSQYEPVASNASERGRKKNRRIEIVLEPNLIEIDGNVRDSGEVDLD